MATDRGSPSTSGTSMLDVSPHNAVHRKVDGTATTAGRVLMGGGSEALAAEGGFLNSNPYVCANAQDDR